MMDQGKFDILFHHIDKCKIAHFIMCFILKRNHRHHFDQLFGYYTCDGIYDEVDVIVSNVALFYKPIPYKYQYEDYKYI